MEAQLTVEEGGSVGSQHVVQAGQTRILGRGPGADLSLPDPALAPQNTAVRLDPDGLRVVDLGGPTGTFLNDRRLQPQTPTLTGVGDELRLGEHLLRIELFGDDGRAVRGSLQPGAGEALPNLGAGFGVLRKLGTGGMGSVYLAVRQSDQLQVAVKVLHEQIQPGTPQHERFMREGAICARVESPYVARVLDLGLIGTTACIAMELLEGTPLDARLGAGPLALPEAVRVAEDVAQALVAVAAAGVVHRDVKPENIVLTREGLAKLTDFGIAKDLDSTLKSLTISGQGLGTLAYLPPEQVSEAKYADARADLYGLGATLYHMVSGRPPFVPGAYEFLHMIVTQDPPPLASLRPDCPPELVQVIYRLLAKDPLERPANARRVGKALHKLRQGLWPDHDFAPLFSG